MISYDKLWQTMKAKNISQYKLIHTYKFSNGLLARLRKSLPTSTYTLERFCRVLDCRVEDLIEYIPDPENREETDKLTKDNTEKKS